MRPPSPAAWAFDLRNDFEFSTRKTGVVKRTSPQEWIQRGTEEVRHELDYQLRRPFLSTLGLYSPHEHEREERGKSSPTGRPSIRLG